MEEERIMGITIWNSSESAPFLFTFSITICALFGLRRAVNRNARNGIP